MHIEVAAKTPLAWRFPWADRVLELALVCIIATGSLGLLAALAGVFHAPQIWMLGVLLTAVYQRRTAERGILWSTPSSWTHVALLVLVALFFRLPAFDYIRGGQDQGIYVNIANHILQSGGIDVSDPIAEMFSGTSTLQQYLSSNRISDHEFLLGVFTTPGSVTKLQFQFYHLFPVWMALIGGVFGTAYAVYALTIFSVLSILFAYRLVLTITARPKAALAAGMLFAVNPMHAFFSKFPVTEVPTLAFSLAAFCYLSAYWTTGIDRRQRRMLYLAFFAMTSLFFVRISGFMYIPFIAVLACLVALFDEDPSRRRAIQYWAVAIVASYALSVFYGLHWSHQYATAIYEASFGLVLGERWRAWLVVLLLAVAVLWIASISVLRTPVFRQVVKLWVLNPIRCSGIVIIIIALAIVAFRVYSLGWTGHYSQDSWLNDRWGLSGSRWRALKATSCAQLVVYMGPILFGSALALLCRPRQEPVLEYMRLVTMAFCTYSLVLTWVIPYGPYYDRYLLSETLPYLIIFTVCVWPRLSGRSNTLMRFVIMLSIVYGGVVSAAQIGKEENKGLHGAMAHLVSQVDAHDVILLDSLDSSPPDTNATKTPLLFTFGKNVITVSGRDLSNATYISSIAGRFDDVYLISPNAEAPRGFTELDSVRASVWVYKWGYGPPRSLELLESPRLYLSRRDRPQLSMGVASEFDQHGEWNDWLKGGWSDPESWGVWAVGPEASFEIDAGELPPAGDGVMLHFELRAFVSEQHPRQRAEVAVNGGDVKSVEVTYPANTATFDLPVSTRSLRNEDKIAVHLSLPDAVSPKLLGIGGDTRALSFGLVSVEARPLMPSADSVPAERKGGEKGVGHE